MLCATTILSLPCPVHVHFTYSYRHVTSLRLLLAKFGWTFGAAVAVLIQSRQQESILVPFPELRHGWNRMGLLFMQFKGSKEGRPCISFMYHFMDWTERRKLTVQLQYSYSRLGSQSLGAQGASAAACPSIPAIQVPRLILWIGRTQGLINFIFTSTNQRFYLESIQWTLISFLVPLRTLSQTETMP